MKIPAMMRVDPRFYEAYMDFKMRGEVMSLSEYQRRLIQMLEEHNKKTRFFK
jgi:hypothetical protein